MRGEVAISQKTSQWWGCLQVKIVSAALTFRWYKCQKCLQRIEKIGTLISKQGFWRQTRSWILPLLKVKLQHFREISVLITWTQYSTGSCVSACGFLYCHPRQLFCNAYCSLPAKGYWKQQLNIAAAECFWSSASVHGIFFLSSWWFSLFPDSDYC